MSAEMLFERVTSSPAWREAVSVLLHTLWQAPAVAAMLWAALRGTSARRANLRYAACVAAMAVLIVLAAVTWSVSGRARIAFSGSGSSASPRVASSSLGNSSTSTGTPGQSVASGRSEAPRMPSAAESLTPAHERSHEASALAGPPPTDSSDQQPSLSAAAPAWPAAVGVAWLAGTAIMLVRMLCLVAGARRLVRTASPLRDGPAAELLATLRAQLKMTRRVALVVSDHLSSPAVVGILRPAIVLPASVVSGLPPDLLAAVLVHELAHIRRWDYLINLAQLALEALLFFNPAVWWISRQVRVEREACCDAVAVAATVKPARYAEALARFAERMAPPARDAWHPAPAAAMAMSGHDPGEKPTLDRVSRILLPDYRPRLRLTWPSLFAVLLAGAILFAGMWRGTEKAVAIAAEMLTPQQRLEKLVAATQASGPVAIRHSDDPKDRVTVTGAIRTPDGKPLPGGGWIHAHVRADSHSTSTTLGQASESFTGKLPPGVVFIAVQVPGYAPTSVGPFTGNPGSSIGPVEVVLAKGFVGRVRLVDEAAKPVPNAKVTGYAKLEGGAGIDTFQADADGVITFTHAADAPYDLTLEAEGFETDKQLVQLKPNETIDWPVVRAAATSAVVVDPAGKPVAGATVRSFASILRESLQAQDWNGKVLATTDADGRFQLTNLRRDLHYVLRVEADGFGKHLEVDVRAGETDRRITLAPPRVIRGRVVGDLEALRGKPGRDGNPGGPVVSYASEYRIGSSGYVAADEKVVVTPTDGGGTFEIRDPLPVRLRVHASGAKSIEVDASRPVPHDFIVLRLMTANAPQREVIVRLRTEPGAPPASGTIHLQSNDADNAQEPLYKTVELTNGAARFSGYVGGRLSVRPQNLLGCWFEERYDLKLPPGDGPETVEIDTLPAGAIVGTFVDADGKPLGSDSTLSVYTVTRPPALDPGKHISNPNGENPVNGKFMISPLPLGGTYAVKGSRGKTFVMSKPILVDGVNPVPSVDLRIPANLVDAVVKVVDKDGRPLAGMPVEFSYHSPHGGHGFSPLPTTDGNGMITFTGINPAAPGSYSVTVAPQQRYRSAKADLPLKGGATTVVALQPGMELIGRVVDGDGKPIPNAEVQALSVDLAKLAPNERIFQYKPEGKTDAEGRFQFSNLAPGDYRIMATPPWSGIRYSPQDCRATAGQAAEAEVVIKRVE